MSAGEGKIVLPDADLLLSGSYSRVGPDLIIEGGGKKAVVVGYFAEENAAALFSESGANLDGATVRALAGDLGGWQVAQVGGGSGPDPIGTVTTLTGTATVQRGGTVSNLTVVQTAADASRRVKQLHGVACSGATDPI